MSEWDAHDRWLEYDATDAEAASVLAAQQAERRWMREASVASLREALEKFRPEDKEEEKAG